MVENMKGSARSKERSHKFPQEADCHESPLSSMWGTLVSKPPTQGR